jgi:hypothetical protein
MLPYDQGFAFHVDFRPCSAVPSLANRWFSVAMQAPAVRSRPVELILHHRLNSNVNPSQFRAT